MLYRGFMGLLSIRFLFTLFLEDGSGFQVRIQDLDHRTHQLNKVLVKQMTEIIIPSYSSWFSMKRVHELECKALPEFFNNKNKSKAPSVYKDYRDFMINTYRLNPDQYLTATACRRNLVGDVCAIIRVHSFLEQWGLINYQVRILCSSGDFLPNQGQMLPCKQVKYESRPAGMGPPSTEHFKVTVNSPKGYIQQYMPPQQPDVRYMMDPYAHQQSKYPEAHTTNTQQKQHHPSHVPTPNQLMTSKNIYSDVFAASPQQDNIGIKRNFDALEEKQPPPDQSRKKKLRFACSTCDSDCSALRYHTARFGDVVDVCKSCYQDGRFSSTLCSSDFIKLESTPEDPDGAEQWADQEVLLLLEGLEMYDEDWEGVANHVGTRTKDECILKFLGLPIDEPYTNLLINTRDPLQQRNVPFSAADNPVLSVTAFLAASVVPEVAKAAAHAAVEAIKKLSDEKKKTLAPSANFQSHSPSTTPENIEVKIKQEITVGNDSQPSIDIKSEALSGSEVPQTGQRDATQQLDHSKQPLDFDSAANPQKALGIAMGSAAAKAYAVEQNVISEYRDLMFRLIQTQMSKIQIKVEYLDTIEQLLLSELEEIEREKSRLFLEKIAHRKRVLKLENMLSKLRGGENNHTIISKTFEDRLSLDSNQPGSPITNTNNLKSGDSLYPAQYKDSIQDIDSCSEAAFSSILCPPESIDFSRGQGTDGGVGHGPMNIRENSIDPQASRPEDISWMIVGQPDE